MLTYMLDTNICISAMKNYPPNHSERWQTGGQGRRNLSILGHG
jgi:predicted nucleic acid-binding protein